MQTPLNEWYFHPTEDNVDVAIMEAPINLGDGIDQYFWRVEHFAINKIIKGEEIGTGDERVYYRTFR